MFSQHFAVGSTSTAIPVKVVHSDPQEEPGGARRSQVEPGGARWSQDEPGGRLEAILYC